MSYEYFDNLPAEARARYQQKLDLVGLDMCPYKIRADVWKNDPKSWPDILYPNIFNYLIKSPRIYSPEAMENFKSLDSYRFFVSGWVQTVEHFQPTSSHFIFKADVKPSYRVTDDPHHAWVAATKNGKVIAGHCDCMAGLGETCSHVGALLFKIEAAVRLGYTKSACTDEPCAWNQCFVKDVQPARVRDIKFYTEASRAKVQKTDHRKLYSPATKEDQDRFLKSLAEIGRPIVGLSAFPEYAHLFIPKRPPPPKKQLPKMLRSLYDASKEFPTKNDLQKYCEHIASTLSVSKSEAAYLAEVTTSQASSTHWHHHRAGRITASMAHSFLHTSKDNPAPSLLKKVCMTESAPLRVPAVQWGKDHEDDAFELYKHVMCGSSLPDGITVPSVVYQTSEETHTEFTITKSGLIVPPEYPFLGASPDGLVSCQCHGKGVLEIKCPFSYREQGVKEAIKDATFYLDEEYCLKVNHSYYTQVQFQMLVCNVVYADFVVWTLKDCSIHRVIRNDPFIQTMEQQHHHIWTYFILPELVTRQLEGGEKDEAIPGPLTVAKEYCLCRSQVVDDTMVGCDKCDDWFHLRCLKLKRVPRAKSWYCPGCRKVRQNEQK